MLSESDDSRILRSAAGYAQLGMYAEARQELDSLAPAAQESPQALAVLADIHRGRAQWMLMLAVVKQLADLEPENPQWPISHAYATRRAESIEAAKPILLDAGERHPREPIIWFNLACYECQTGNINAARAYLDRALKLEPKCKSMALEDEDLLPLRDSLIDSLEP